MSTNMGINVPVFITVTKLFMDSSGRYETAEYLINANGIRTITSYKINGNPPAEVSRITFEGESHMDVIETMEQLKERIICAAIDLAWRC